ncbi:MAG TPA: dihydrolipoamide acetyltransferase family protein [Trebonia sp.]|jgi:pyruvate dehydrogenase E2 component (dihydrolipoamide acetyltransferase)
MIEIKMPRLSDTMEEGAISTWHKKPGDTVAVGDVLVEIETDKAVMEYEAYQGGTLAEILVPEGQNADIGAPIALLDDGTGGPATAASAASAPTDSPERTQPTAPAPADSAPVAAPPAAGASPANGTANGASNGTANGAARQIASPLVRKLARENHLDLSHVTGSGPGGRIIRADLSDLLAAGHPATPQSVPTQSPAAVPPAASSSPAPAAAAAEPGSASAETDDVRGTRGVPISQVRRVIARRLSASASEIPHFYVTAVADAQDLMDLRATLNAQLTEAGRAAAGRAKISVNDLLIRACALALREHQEVNVSYGGDTSSVMLVHDRVNVGVAVAAESGLIVPVIRDADTKTVTQLGAEAKKLVALAAERKLTPAQTSGGTFTISNLGMYGVEHFTAIINPPESAILAVGATTREPTVVGDTLEPRYRLRYTLSVDHRVIDGALAAKFLQTLTNLVEHPWMIIA